jgi:MFS family permease
VSVRKAWYVWGIGCSAYVMAVFNRSSLGVTGVQAQHRFHASAGVLSLFAVLQLAVYASLQVPVGVVLDRLGSRRMLVSGGMVMAAGQLLLATSHSVPGALAARVLVGAGDAMSFISVLRLANVWFPPRHIPVVTQLTGLVGPRGPLAAAYPLVALLGAAGWSRSFLAVALVGLAIALVVRLALSDTPPGWEPLHDPASLAEFRVTLGRSWAEPGTRLGLWTHFVTQFSGVTFALLWGYPFLTVGEGRSASTAGLLLMLMVVFGTGFGPLMGTLAGRWPLRRSAMVFGIVGASAAIWTLLLLWPGRAPLWLLVLLVVVLASNGPGSMVGFDYARTFNPSRRIGSASGIVNVGGFVASLTTILAIGLVLDALTPHGSTAYTLNSFRVAFLVQYPLWVLGLVLVVRNRRTVRARLAAEGVLPDALPQAVVRRLRAHRSLSGR